MLTEFARSLGVRLGLSKREPGEQLSLPSTGISAVIDIDNGDARVTHDRDGGVLTVKLYSNEIPLKLDSFTGELKLTGGGSTIDVYRVETNSPLEIKVNYFWAGYPANGTIQQNLVYEGGVWRQTFYKDDR